MDLAEKNHFELFGLDVGYDVDQKQLKQRFLALQKTAHPDNFATLSDSERYLAVRRSGYINDAYQTLKDPVARGRYMLAFFGVDRQVGQTISDSAILMEQLELREQIAEAKSVSNGLEIIRGLLDTIVSRSKVVEQELTQIFDRQTQPMNSDLANLKLNQLQFFSKLREEALDLEVELDQ